MYFISEIRKIPLFRIITPFILGIAFAIYNKFEFHSAFIFAIIFLSLAFIVSSIQFKFREIIFGIFIAFTLFLSGIEIVQIHNTKKETNLLSQNNTFVAQLLKTPKVSEKTVQAEIEIQFIKIENTLHQTHHKSIVYLPIDTNSLQLSIGQQIIFKANFKEIQNLGNPDEFDYANYMANHQIYNQAFIKSDQWQILETESGFTIQTKALEIRNKIIQHFQELGIKDQQLAVLSALSLGYKNKLDEDIKHAYSNSGGMHVLAVSGLHVGIIYFIMAFLLKTIRKKKYGKYLATIIIILFLWFYAFLTGLSPSVFRASTMFTIIAIGSLFKRNTNIYNSLAASAFILLLVNPYFLTEIGFQLSYLAVIGIVYFHPKIYGWITFKNILLDKAWSLTAVSLAAQIATAPISLYYFGQFPVYFLLTNFIVIPFASILIYGTILFLLFSFFNPAALLFAKALNSTVAFLNHCIQFIEQLPGSLISQIELPFISMILSYIIIIFLSAYFAYRLKKFLYYSFIALILLASVHSFNKIQDANNSHFIVFNIPGNTFVQIKNKANTTNIFDIDNTQKNYVLNQHIGRRKNEKIILIKQNSEILKLDQNLFLFNNQKILFPPSKILLKDKIPDQKIFVDYVVYTSQTDMNIKNILSYFDFTEIIFDSSISFYEMRNLEKFCDKNNIPFQSTRTNGAFIKEL
jgi:competence protein ComEC